MALLRRPLTHTGLIDRRARDAAIRAPQPALYWLEAIEEFEQHAVLLLEHVFLLVEEFEQHAVLFLEHLVLLEDAGGQQGKGELVLVIHDLFLE